MKPSIQIWQAGAILIATLAMALFWRTQLFYPSLDFATPAGPVGHIVGAPRETEAACRADLELQRRIATANCPDCAIAGATCSTRRG